MKARLTTLLLLLVVATVTVACGNGSEGTSGDNATNASGPTTFSVGMALPGPINDQGFNQAGYAGLQAIEQEGAKINYIENVDPAGQVQALQNLASEKPSLVIAYGADFNDSVLQVAPSFPDVSFTIFEGTSIASNVNAYGMRWGEGSFVAGALAAMLSKSKVVGFIGGAEIPPTILASKGFEAGAKYVDPSVKVESSIVGDFNDAPKAKEAALGQIADGADVIYSFVDAGLPGVTDAVQSASQPVKQIGYILPHCDTADTFVGDAIFDSVSLFAQVGQAVKDGTWKPNQVANIGLENPDVVRMSFCSGRVDSAVQTKIDDLIKSVVNGEVKLPEGV